MTIEELIKENTNISITVNSADLLEFARQIVNDAINRRNEIKGDEIRYTKAEVMELTKKSSASLSRWSKMGYLIPVKVGKSVFYKKSDVDKILKR